MTKIVPFALESGLCVIENWNSLVIIICYDLFLLLKSFGLLSALLHQILLLGNSSIK